LVEGLYIFTRIGDNKRFKISYQADAMNNVKNAEKREEDLENCDVYDAHCVNTFASKNQNDENDVMEHTLKNENDEQSRAQEAVATDVVTVSEQIRPEGKKKVQNSRKRKAYSHEGSSALDESAASLATSSLKLPEAYVRSQKMKAEIAVRQIAVEEAKAQVEKMKAQVDICKMLLDPTASAPEGEKKNVRKSFWHVLNLRLTRKKNKILLCVQE
jgi:hypothetical protein